MKTLKFIQDGWESYTGTYMGVEFVDGVSVEPVDSRTANRMGCIVSLETVEADGSDGKNPSAAQALIDNNTQVMVSQDKPQGEPEKPAVKIYTRLELEAIASDKGMPGLREIAEPLNIRANSINKLIESLLGFYGVAPGATGPTDETPAAPPITAVVEKAVEAPAEAPATPAAEGKAEQSDESTEG